MGHFVTWGDLKYGNLHFPYVGLLDIRKTVFPYFLMHGEIRKYWFSIYLGAPPKENGDFHSSGPLMCQNVPFSVKRNNFVNKEVTPNPRGAKQLRRNQFSKWYGDGPTNQRTNQQTNIVSNRGATSRLKKRLLVTGLHTLQLTCVKNGFFENLPLKRKGDSLIYGQHSVARFGEKRPLPQIRRTN
jgi:hypothetical protein